MTERTSAGLGVTGLSVRLPGEAVPVLRDVNLELKSGRVVGVSGRSGTGKSTLLHAISGLVPWLRSGEVRGDVSLDGESMTDLDPGQRAHLVSTCLDRPEAQLFLPMVRQEIASACRLHQRLDSILGLADSFGIRDLMDRKITELSSGQRQRVALACAFAACPKPVLLDEPTAHLDADGVASLQTAVTSNAGAGGSFLVAEQAGWRLDGAVDSWTRIEDGNLRSRSAPDAPEFPKPPKHGERVIVACRGVAVSRGGSALLSEVEFEIREGEVVLLTGANGAGKSSLALVMAGIRGPETGEVVADRRVALMLPSAELQLFAGTVATEAAASGGGRAETARVLRRHRLEHLAARAPWTLSRGERQRLVHARLDLMRPEVMIVDEPAQGLDPQDLAAFVDLVHRRAEKGRAYLIISHREELAPAVHRRLEIRDKRVVEV
jgi:energy-coupling factor transport system ATP-binding protein